MLRRISVFKSCQVFVNNNNLASLLHISKVNTRSYTPCEDYTSLATLTTKTSEMEENIKFTREILNDISAQPYYLLSSISVEERTQSVLWGDYHQNILDKIEEYKKKSEEHTKKSYEKHGDYASRLLYDEEERLQNKIAKLKCCECHSLLAHAICKNDLFSLEVEWRAPTRNQLVFHHDHRLKDLKHTFEQIYFKFYAGKMHLRWMTVEDDSIENDLRRGINSNKENTHKINQELFSLYQLYRRMKNERCFDIEAEDLEFWDREMSSF